jgi:hypothetical protein
MAIRTSLDDAFMASIVERLQAYGLTAAAVEQTGGWIWCITIPDRDGLWYWGLADDYWGASLMLDGACVEDRYRSVAVRCEDNDAEAVAKAIYEYYR